MGHKILPDLICDSKGFEPSKELPQVEVSCVVLPNEVRFKEVESEDIEELPQSHTEDLSTEELQQLVAEAQMEGMEEDDVVQ